ncbi:MAG: hypothetical protein ACTTJH_06610 [Bacteroidales bacterium]
MKERKDIFLVALISIILLCSACVDENDFKLGNLSQSTISPEVEANLLKMNFSADDFFGQISDTTNGVSIVANNDTLHLKMIQDFSVSGQDLQHNYFNKNVSVKLLDFNFDNIIIPTIEGSNFSENTPIVTNQTIDLVINAFTKYDKEETERMIDSVILSSGELVFTGNSNVPYDIEVDLKSDQIVNEKTGEHFHQVLQVSKQGSLNKKIDMSHYKMKFNAKSDNTSTISFTYSVTLLSAGQPINGGTYTFNLQLNGQDLDIDIAWGIVGNPTIPISGILNVNYFDSTIKSDMLELKQVDMFVDVINYTGLELFLNLDDLKAKNHVGYISSIFEKGKQVSIGKALNPGEIKLTQHHLSINPTAMTKMPNQILYELKSIFDSNSQKGFVYPSKKYLDIHTVIDIPLQLKVNDFVSEKETDALAFLKNEKGVGDYIDSAVLKLSFKNTFPANLKLEIYTKSESGFIAPLLDKVVEIESAKVDNNGKVISGTNKNENVFISTQRYEQLRNADKILFKATFNTSEINGEKPFVVFNKSCSLDVTMGIKAHTSISF